MLKSIMKTLTLLMLFSSCTLSYCIAQLRVDYPFKAHLDSANNLYVAGYEFTNGTTEIISGKYPPQNNAPPFGIKYSITFLVTTEDLI